MGCTWNILYIVRILIIFRFLLAQLHLDSLRGKRSPKAIRTALTKLRKGSDAYDIAYHNAMERIQGQLPDQKELAFQALSWITSAKRPLTTAELLHALGVELDQPDFDNDNLPDLQDLVSSCCGLVTIDTERDVIRLVHYTTQEYFERTQKTWFPNTQSEIARTCITYLSFQPFEIGMCASDLDFENRLASYPLYDYASHHWGNHAFLAPGIPYSSDFLRLESKVAASIQGLLARKDYLEHLNYSQNVPTEMNGLHLAAFFGLHETTVILMDDQDIDKRDSYGRTPISYAAQNGHMAVVRLLLEKGADIDSKAKGKIVAGMTPLSYAAQNGHTAVVRLLLEKGADIDSKAKGKIVAGMTPLSFAAKNEHMAVVRLLLERGADVNSKDISDTTALLHATIGDNVAIVKLLLENGAEVNIKDVYGKTPLLYAAKHKNGAIIKRLLASHANP